MNNIFSLQFKTRALCAGIDKASFKLNDAGIFYSAASKGTFTLIVCLFAFVSLVAAAAIVLLCLRCKASKETKLHDEQIIHMFKSQGNTDILWGDLKTGKIVSKSGNVLQKKWKITDSEVVGINILEIFKNDLRTIEEKNLVFFEADMKLEPAASLFPCFIRRYTYKTGENTFMAFLFDVTFEKLRENELSRMANTDYLLQLLNRRAMDTNLKEISSNLNDREEKTGKKHYVLMFDLDNFKKVNDNYGHDIGDKVLIAASKCIIKNAGEDGLCSRWGGEEFLAMICAENDEKAVAVAQQILDDFSSTGIHVTERNKIYNTVSCGVARLSSDVPYHKSIANADDAMYKAKLAGKNRVVLFTE